jgi:hypothetical protein
VLKMLSITQCNDRETRGPWASSPGRLCTLAPHPSSAVDPARPASLSAARSHWQVGAIRHPLPSAVLEPDSSPSLGRTRLRTAFPRHGPHAKARSRPYLSGRCHPKRRSSKP